ncbi:hypothetical protein chiPu_0026062, partial [Chiloscyllium punctatum]|nr:hypothetical protein [Chiloscyllium punctatum]
RGSHTPALIAALWSRSQPLPEKAAPCRSLCVRTNVTLRILHIETKLRMRLRLSVDL